MYVCVCMKCTQGYKELCGCPNIQGSGTSVAGFKLCFHPQDLQGLTSSVFKGTHKIQMLFHTYTLVK